MVLVDLLHFLAFNSTQSAKLDRQFLKMKVSDESVYECARATYSKGRGGGAEPTDREGEMLC